jgi:hypothetical protein
MTSVLELDQNKKAKRKWEKRIPLLICPKIFTITLVHTGWPQQAIRLSADQFPPEGASTNFLKRHGNNIFLHSLSGSSEGQFQQKYL